MRRSLAERPSPPSVESELSGVDGQREETADQLRTDFPFVLPRGYVDAAGTVHRAGSMRLATARDELVPLRDDRVRENPAYLTVVLLGRVITRLGTLDSVHAGIVEDLFAGDVAFLQDLYRGSTKRGTPARPSTVRTAGMASRWTSPAAAWGNRDVRARPAAAGGRVRRLPLLLVSGRDPRSGARGPPPVRRGDRPDQPGADTRTVRVVRWWGRRAVPAVRSPVAAPRREWSALPPIQRTVSDPVLTAPDQVFRSGLRSWRDPSFLAPLRHAVSPGGPAGSVDGLVLPSPGPALQRFAESPGGGPVAVFGPSTMDEGSGPIGQRAPSPVDGASGQVVQPRAVGGGPLLTAPPVDGPVRTLEPVVEASPPVDPGEPAGSSALAETDRVVDGGSAGMVQRDSATSEVDLVRPEPMGPVVRAEPATGGELVVRRGPVVRPQAVVRREPVVRLDAVVQREPTKGHEPDVQRAPTAGREPDVQGEPIARREAEVQREPATAVTGPVEPAEALRAVFGGNGLGSAPGGEPGPRLRGRLGPPLPEAEPVVPRPPAEPEPAASRRLAEPEPAAPPSGPAAVRGRASTRGRRWAHARGGGGRMGRSRGLFCVAAVGSVHRCFRPDRDGRRAAEDGRCGGQAGGSRDG